jgi:hypothetical protein
MHLLVDADLARLSGEAAPIARASAAGLDF